MKVGIAGILRILIFLSSFVLLSILMFTSLPTYAPGQDDINLFVTVAGARPSIGAISCHNTSTPLTPTAGINTTMWCFATVTDTNGYSDVNQSSLNVSFFGNGAQSELERADDLNNHYNTGAASHTGTNCTWTGASGNTIVANCSFTLRHYMDPGTYNVTFNVSDNNSYYNHSSVLYTINNITAVNVTNATLNFGSVALGGTSSQLGAEIQNWGNSPFDISVAETGGTAGEMNCTVASFGTGNETGIGVRYNATTGFSFIEGESAYRLVGTQNATGNITDWDQVYANATGTTDTSSLKNLFWLLKLPSGGLSGTCSGVATILTRIAPA